MEASLSKRGKKRAKRTFGVLNRKNNFPFKIQREVNNDCFLIFWKVVFITPLMRHGKFWGGVTENNHGLTRRNGGQRKTNFRVGNARKEN